MRNRQAFTLIELLIVVAIIAILAAIAVPNFLEAQVRAKVSRTKADMRSIATAIESYRVDHNKYPYVTNWGATPPVAFGVPGGYHMGDPTHAEGLTTPVAYMTSIPKDPFGGSRSSGDLYANLAMDDYFYASKAYFTDPSRNFPWLVDPSLGSEPGDDPAQALWVLESKGPDRAWARAAPQGPGTWELDQPYKWQYDPTNGTVSSGNIVRSGP